jgi:hypothetical protein
LLSHGPSGQPVFSRLRLDGAAGDGPEICDRRITEIDLAHKSIHIIRVQWQPGRLADDAGGRLYPDIHRHRRRNADAAGCRRGGGDAHGSAGAVLIDRITIAATATRHTAGKADRRDRKT